MQTYQVWGYTLRNKGGFQSSHFEGLAHFFSLPGAFAASTASEQPVKGVTRRRMHNKCMFVAGTGIEVAWWWKVLQKPILKLPIRQVHRYNMILYQSRSNSASGFSLHLFQIEINICNEDAAQDLVQNICLANFYAAIYCILWGVWDDSIFLCKLMLNCSEQNIR